MVPMPALNPSMSFDDACTVVVDYLTKVIPMGYWAVSRYDGTDQLYLAVEDDAYGMAVGDHIAWSDSFCQYSVSGEAPRIAPDAMAVPQYATTAMANSIPVGSYIGFPIHRAGGQLFGTICGADRTVRSSDLEEHAPLLELLASLLSAILEADSLRTDQARRLERAELVAETDELTGLVNRHGWNRSLAREELRYRRFGDPASIVMVDLDGLKEINDTGGHRAGDERLRLAAQVLRRSVRGDDLVARLGGDEFGVLALGSTPAQAEILVRRLRQAFDAAGVPSSIGLAPCTFAGGFVGAWHAADLQMYEEKRRRKSPTHESDVVTT
jgi:diguanylate cyclase (GGDEF)-like protein